jgi:hypothetical protein
MSMYVLAFFIVQLLVGAYMFTFVLGAGQLNSNARATRIPDPIAVVHPLAAGGTFLLWVIYLLTDERAFAWATFVALLLTASGGAVMALKTLRGRPVVNRPAADPADVRVAEKQIPKAAIVLHGLTFLVLLAGTLLVALGVGD